VCCRVFQSVAEYCSVLQYVAVCVAVCCSTWQVLSRVYPCTCGAVCGSLLQCFAECCRVLQMQSVAECCRVLQCVAVCVAVCCSTWQVRFGVYPYVQSRLPPDFFDCRTLYVKRDLHMSKKTCTYEKTPMCTRKETLIC